MRPSTCWGATFKEADPPASLSGAIIVVSRGCGYALSYRDGKNVYYTIGDPRVRKILHLAQQFLCGNLLCILEWEIIIIECERKDRARSPAFHPDVSVRACCVE